MTNQAAMKDVKGASLSKRRSTEHEERINVFYQLFLWPRGSKVNTK